MIKVGPATDETGELLWPVYDDAEPEYWLCACANEQDADKLREALREDVRKFAYRCGFCGMPCDENGEPMGDEAPKTSGDTEHVYGRCCPPETQTEHYVTRDMALDAGDPDLEGQPY